MPDGEACLPMIARPADFHGRWRAPRSTAAERCQHTDEVLAELESQRRPTAWSGAFFTRSPQNVTLATSGRGGVVR